MRLASGSKREATVLGPRDHERQTKLNKIEKDIFDGRQYQGAPPTLAEDALCAAELTRGLEKPRYETDGRYERAVRLAREHKLPTHELKAVYGWAWTSYFWFDDATKLNTLYAEVEKLALASDNADDLERLNNLLPLLINAVAHEVLTTEEAAIDSRRISLMNALERAHKDESRPNNSLHAHSLLLTLRLTETARSGDLPALDSLWEGFTEIIKKADGLGTFHFRIACRYPHRSRGVCAGK